MVHFSKNMLFLQKYQDAPLSVFNMYCHPLSKPLEEIRLTIYLAPPGMCRMLPVLPRGFPLPMREGRSKGQRGQSESSCERKDVGAEVVDNNDNVNAMNNTEMIDKLE